MKFFNRDGKLVDPPMRRLKFTDNSGYIKDRLVEIPHSSCPTHDAAAEQVPKLHLWFHPTADASAGASGESRTDYGYAGAPDTPASLAARQDQRLRPGEFAGPATTEEFPTASYGQGAEPHPLFDRRDQTGPSPPSTPSPPSSMAAPDEDDGRPLYPPHQWYRPGTELDELGQERWIRGGGDRRYIDAGSLRLSGRDEQGRHWNAKVFGPEAQAGEDFPKVEPGMANDARRLLTNLERGDAGNSHVMGLRLYQQVLNKAYARR
jgi:hypothetical protein